MFLISELHIKKNSKKLYAFVCLDACSIVLQTYKTGTGLPQNHRKVFLQTNNGMLYFVVQCQCANVCCFFFLLNCRKYTKISVNAMSLVLAAHMSAIVTCVLWQLRLPTIKH